MRLLEEIELDEARARLRFAEWNHASTANLAHTSAASKADVMRAEMELDLARLAVERAQVKLERCK